MTSIVIVSDFDMRGSGYQQITSHLGDELHRRGYRVTVLGLGYKGEEHRHPFGIIPVPWQGYDQLVPARLGNLKGSELADAVIIAQDIPGHGVLLDKLAPLGIPYYGIFPLEAPPLVQSWAYLLMQMTGRFCISEFGTRELAEKKVPATFLPLPVDMETPTDDEPIGRVQLRSEMGIPDGKKVVLTIADNQERKNLGTTAEIIAQVPDAIWFCVTRLKSRFGWNLHDLVEEYGISDRCMLIERGISRQQITQLYRVADAFLIASKAEGFGFPVLEAMQAKVPVVAPNHTAFTEHLSDGRGYLFENAYEYRDPFGNEWRYFADAQCGAAALKYALAMGNEVIHKAYEYASSRTWERVGELICQALPQ